MKHKFITVLTTTAIASLFLISPVTDSAITKTSKESHILKPTFSILYLLTYYKWNEPGVEKEGWIHEFEVGLSLRIEWCH